MSLLRVGNAVSRLLPSSTRHFSRSALRNKALENWKRPSMDEMLAPKEPWSHVHQRNQKKFNAQLLVGSTAFGVTLFFLCTQYNFNSTPDYKKVHYSSILPIVETSETSKARMVGGVEKELEEEEASAPAVEEDVTEHHASSQTITEEPEAEPDTLPEPVAPSETPTPTQQTTSSDQEGAVVKDVAADTTASPAPVRVSGLPSEVEYLLVGAGTASFAAFRAIKARDPTAKILMIGDEDRIPYMRPPLSKELWFVNEDIDKNDLKFKKWNGRERSLYFEPKAFYTDVDKLEESKNGGVSVLTGKRVVKIDADNQMAELEDGTQIKYAKCLLATGGTPKTMAVLKDLPEDMAEHVTLFRKVDDFINLNQKVQKAKSVTIFGGGFLGSELACALGQRSKAGLLEVNQVYQEAGNMAKVLPEYLSEWTTDKVRSEGVNVIPKSRVKAVTKKENGRLNIELSEGSLETDHVVVAVGVEPDHNLANASGLKVDSAHGGFIVNDQFEAVPNLWVAGDAAAFLDPQLGRRRVEHHDHAVVSGRLAGENMTGANKSYTHQSMFWSDLGPEVGYEAIGIVDSKLPTVGVFAKATDTDTPKAVVTQSDESDRSISEAVSAAIEPAVQATSAGGSAAPDQGQDYGKGVIFYLQENKIVGVLLWNVFNRIKIARRVLREEKSYDDLTEVAKLFNIHAEE